jgi:DNA-binding transcriptional LysR family regulator
MTMPVSLPRYSPAWASATLPPVVQPDLVRDGRLIVIMPEWHFRIFDLWMVHPGNRHISRPVRPFKEFAVPMARALFPSLPA